MSETLVVIPCLNEEAHLDGLLAQLTADAGCRSAVIVVADGGSKDRSREIVAAWAARDGRVRLLDNPARIQSAGVNLAVRQQGEGASYLVRIDAHCHYPDGYVERLLAALRDTGAQSVVVPMQTQGISCFQRAAAAAQNSKLGTGGSAHRTGGLSAWVDHGHHAAWTMQAYRGSGGYDETFSHNEDAELDARLTAAGNRIWLAGDIPIVYFPRRALGPLMRQYYGYGRGRARNLRRHRMPIKLRQALPLLVAPAVLAAPLGFIFPLAAVPAAIWATACLCFGALLALKARDACVTASGVAAMAMHLSWSSGFWRERIFAPHPGPFSAPK